MKKKSLSNYWQLYIAVGHYCQFLITPTHHHHHHYHLHPTATHHTTKHHGHQGRKDYQNLNKGYQGHIAIVGIFDPFSG